MWKESLQMKIFCRCNSVPKAKQQQARNRSYLTRNSCLKTVRFWVNLSLFFESKLRVTFSISLSKQRASRWCWSTGCKTMERKSKHRDHILETGGGIMGARKAPIIYRSFNCSSSNPKTKCNLQITHDRQLWGCMSSMKLKNIMETVIFFSFLFFSYVYNMRVH